MKQFTIIESMLIVACVGATMRIADILWTAYQAGVFQ